jgi:heme oxygenase
MSNLKELTWEHHKEAERQDFVKVMMSGKMHPEFYATYLWNQHMRYDLLEALALANGVLIPISEVCRKQAILSDYKELWPHEQPPETVQCVKDYIAHLRGLMTDSNGLMAHIYVLHMGDLSGGQIIKKRVPGSGRMYQFDADPAELKERIRSQCNDDMAEEAKKCFEFSTRLFQELMELDIEHYLEQTN